MFSQPSSSRSGARPAVIAALVLALSSGATSPAPPNVAAHTVGGYEIIKLGRGNLNRLCLASTIDGAKGLLMVDTGASAIALSAGKYDFLLKNGVERPKNIPATTTVNEMSVPVAVGREMQLGTTHLTKVVVTLVPQRFLYQNILGENRQYDGLLGENFLRHYGAIIDCGRLALYLNIDPTRKRDLRNPLTQNGWTEIPMSNIGNDFTVPCTIGGRSFRLIVDTGEPFTKLDADIVRGLQIEQRPLPITGGVIGYRPTQENLVVTDTLQIGSYVASGVHMTSSESIDRALKLTKSKPGESPLLGLLGGDILAANGAMIDIGNHNLYLKHTGASDR